MSYLNCSTLRKSVVIAAALFLGGMAVQAALLYAVNTSTPLLLAVSAVGFYAVLASPLVLLAAAFIATLPPVSDHLTECRH